MILFSFKEQPETRGEDFPCKAFRWSLEAGLFYFGFVHQSQWKDTGEWCSSHSLQYEVCVTKHWAFGSQHIYYDGPHCSFSIGPVHFNWGSWSCTECCP